ncbi:MAG: winged helix-turn-helix domain-containing protein [Candidatus Aenigmatarchaeota archaeon]
MEVTPYHGEKMNLGEFGLEDFVAVIFPGAQEKMREVALIIINELMEGPKTISEIVDGHKLARGTAYDAAGKMQRLGIIAKEGKYAPVRISSKFSLSLERLAVWYRAQFNAKKRG